MASPSLLTVPPKATKSVDFTQPFLRFIGNNYDDNASKYHEVVSEFSGLRESTVVKSPDRHETGLDLITRWAVRRRLGGEGRERESRVAMEEPRQCCGCVWE